MRAATAFVHVRERMIRFERGQDMAEYVLIVSAIAVVVYAVYQIMGQSISALASGADSTLTSA